jgi:hypothetical protein
MLIHQRVKPLTTFYIYKQLTKTENLSWNHDVCLMCWTTWFYYPAVLLLFGENTWVSIHPMVLNLDPCIPSSGWCPPQVCERWFRFTPLTSSLYHVISTMNHRIQPLIHLCSAFLNATSCGPYNYNCKHQPVFTVSGVSSPPVSPPCSRCWWHRRSSSERVAAPTARELHLRRSEA